jgi:hypothetical protein
LITSPNTKPTDWCSVGTITRITTISRTPDMCHHAESVLSRDSRLTLRRLRPICPAAIPVKTRKIAVVSVPTTPGNHRFSRAVVKIAAPYWMAEVTAIWPTRLNQPVNQPQAGPPSLEAQKYSAPAVGIDEAISAIAIAIATNTENTPTSSQPHVMATGPPLLNAR